MQNDIKESDECQIFVGERRVGEDRSTGILIHGSSLKLFFTFFSVSFFRIIRNVMLLS